MEKNVKSKKCETKCLLKIGICFTLLLIAFLTLTNTYNVVLANTETEGIVNNPGTKNEFIYLSDIPYVTAQSRPGWGSLYLNRTDSGGNFSIQIEGGAYSFEKGIWAHATSTVVYDLTNYQNYDYFTTYMGVNTSSGNKGNGVKFYIYTSTDGNNWTLKTENNPPVIKSSNNAIFKKIDIKGAKFLKLYADANGSNGNDHSVYVEPKLIKETYKEPGEELVPSIAELDNKIKTEFANANLETNKQYELTLLKRELIDRVGNFALKKFLSESKENEATFRWLTEDVDNLRLYVLGGKPDGGNYYNSLVILNQLYNEYADDFENTELLNNPTYPKMTYGDLYKKMAMSIALTHTQRVGLWMQNAVDGINDAEPLRRYAIFKYLHKNGGLRISNSMDMTHTFEDLYVEEMRLVLYNNIDDEEVLWLNRYVQDNVDKNPNNVWRYITPHPYIAYIYPNYQRAEFYDPANKDYFNELFAINKTDNNIGKELVNENGEKTGKIGLFDSEFVIPGGKNVSEYRIKITRGTPDKKYIKCG